MKDIIHGEETFIKKSKKREYKNRSRSGILSHLHSLIRHNSLGDLLVRAGYLSPLQMRGLLKSQNSTSARLGQLAIRAGYVRPHHIVYLLFKQRAIRIFATFITLFVSVLSFSSSKSRAGSLKDIPALVQVSHTPDYQRFEYISKHPEIFEMDEIKSTDLSAFKKWISMFNRFESQLSDNSSENKVKELQDALKEFQNLESVTMIRKVNDLFNSVNYINDKDNWGRSDYWATPIEFMRKGGDCEDFAIAKYVALRALGMPENRLRLTIVKDMVKGIPHALLVVYTDQGPVILDNQSDLVKKSENVFRYKPYYSINRHAWWYHKTPEKPATIVAAAN